MLTHLVETMTWSRMLGFSGRIAVCATTLALLLHPAVATAQRGADLYQGARVRVVANSGHSVTGIVTRYDSASLTVVDPSSHEGSITTAFADASRIEVSAGVSHPEGAAAGGVIGLVVGGVGGWAAGRLSNSRDQMSETIGSFVGALGGIALGITVGGFTGVEHWNAMTGRRL